MGVTLRDYQIDLVERVRDTFKAGIRSVCLTSATGSGKTALTAYMLASASSRGRTSWFLVHRRELISQAMAAFSYAGVDYGVIAPGHVYQSVKPVQIASVFALKRHLRSLAYRPDLIVYDEAHHCSAGSWDKIHSMFPSAYHLGLTATPQRLDGKGLDKYFSRLIAGPPIKNLIERGFLARYKIFAPSDIDTSGLKMRMGDFVREENEKRANTPTVTGSAISHYRRLCPGKRAVVFCVGIAHSQSVVAEFNANGIRAEHVDGSTPTKDRDAAIKRFERGETLVLSNVELFGEGFDLPAIEAAILLRPTASLSLYLQQVGRALRPSPGKEIAIILDHAGNVHRHGMPCADRQWSLEGRKSKAKASQSGPPVRTCPECLATQYSSVPTCEQCGHVFKIEPKEIKVIDGNLEEIKAVKLARARRIEQGRAQSIEQLLEIERARGYKPGWARAIFYGRLKKWGRA